MPAPLRSRATFTRRLALLLFLPASVAVLGCERAPAGISRERFIAANAALRTVPDSAPNADSLRRAALRRSGATAAQLRQFVRLNARRTELLAEVWQAIDDSVQRRERRARTRRAVLRPGAPSPNPAQGAPVADRVRPAELAPPPPPPPPGAPEQPLERIRKPGGASRQPVP